MDGNRTRLAGIACDNRFEGGGAHQVPGHLRCEPYPVIVANVAPMTAPVLFCTDTLWDLRGDEIVSIDPAIEVVRLLGREHVTPSDLERITIAFFSPDAWPDRATNFLGTCVRVPNLEWLQSMSAGTDHSVYTTLRSHGAVVTSAVGAAAPSIAQTVMTYLLALSRELPKLAAAQAARQWSATNIRDLAGMRLGIVGLGAIGAEVARLAAPFGMDVIGMRRTVRGDEPCETWETSRFDDLLRWADAIAVTAPLTNHTRGLFDAEAFAKMRPGAWFVNVGRGEIVNERGLTESLLDGHLGGAGLDVFAVEPLPVESDLWSMPNVIITPHNSGNTERTDRRIVEIFIENFRRRTVGQPLLNVTTEELPG